MKTKEYNETTAGLMAAAWLKVQGAVLRGDSLDTIKKIVRDEQKKIRKHLIKEYPFSEIDPWEENQ